MKVIPIAEKVLTLWRERPPFRPGRTGLMLALLIAVVSAGSWVLLILGSL